MGIENRDRLPIVLNGTHYEIDLTSYRRQTTEPMRQMYDIGGEPTETTLSNEHVWKRTLNSWRKGAGQTYLDDTVTNSDRDRFRASKGINPWGLRTLELLNETELKKTADFYTDTISNREWLIVVNGLLFHIYNTVGAGSQPYHVIHQIVDPTAATWTWTAREVSANSATAGSYEGNITGVVTDGTRLITTWKQGTAIGKQGGMSWWDTTSNTWLADYGPGFGYTNVDFACWANNHLLIGQSSKTQFAKATIWELATDGTPLNGVNPLWSLYQYWTWTASVSAPNGIYIGGFSGPFPGWGQTSADGGGKSIIYYVGINATTGALVVPVPACELPLGEVVWSMQYYSGFVLIGTNLGFRVATIDVAHNGLTYGPLIRTPGAVTCFSVYAEYVWFGYTNYDSGSSGTGRIDLGRFVNELQPAYATDLMSPVGATVQGRVDTIAYIGGRHYFVVANVGVYGETANRVPSGTINQGRMTYSTTESKRFIRMETAYNAITAGETIGVSVTDSAGSTAETATFTGGTSGSLNLNTKTGEWAEITLTLNRSPGTPTISPNIGRLTMRAMPIPRRLEEIYLPIIIKEEVVIGSMSVPMVPITDFNNLKALRDARSLVTLVMGQESIPVFIDNITVGLDQVCALDTWTVDGTWVQGTWMVKCIVVPNADLNPAVPVIPLYTSGVIDASAAPLNPADGQLWFDNTRGRMVIWISPQSIWVEEL